MKSTLLASAEGLAWMAGGLGVGECALGILLWLMPKAPLSLQTAVWMTGLAVVALARGPVTASGVIVLGELLWLAKGQPGHPLLPVEVAAMLAWGWIGMRRPIRPGGFAPQRLLLKFLLAAGVGGAASGIAAALLDPLYRSGWKTSLGGELYTSFTMGESVRPILDTVMVWAGLTSGVVLVSLAILGCLQAAGRRVRALSPHPIRALRAYPATEALAISLLVLWGLALCGVFCFWLLKAPMADDFLLFKKTLAVAVGYVALTLWLIPGSAFGTRRVPSRATLTLGWVATALCAFVFFLSGLHLAENAYSWSTYQAVWEMEAQELEFLHANPASPLPLNMRVVQLSSLGKGALRDYRFIERSSAAPLLGTGYERPEESSPDAAPRLARALIRGYLVRGPETQLATLAVEGGWKDRPLLIYHEAPGVFNRQNRARLVPTGLFFILLLAGLSSLFFLLGRQMARSAAEAHLGRRARRLARRIEARNRELEKLQRQLEATVSQRDSRIRDLTNLAEVGKAVAVLAHEIRNPVATIQMAFGNIIDAMGTSHRGGVGDQVVIVERQIRHINTLTQSVLAFSRGAAGLRKEGRCSSAWVVENCRALCAPAAERYDIELETPLSQPDVIVAARDVEVVQILQNLLVNAIEILASLPDWTPRRVRLLVHRESQGVLFEVEDTGPGLAMEDREKIFDLFYSRKAEGTGLGLFVARELARMLHGNLTVESEDGHGCKFKLQLPCAGEDPGR